MSKPWEQEWRKDEHQMGRVHATDAVSFDIRVAVERVAAGQSAAFAEAQGVIDLALAAPDMARALKFLVNETWGSQGVEEAKGMAIAALRKAGVPL